MTPFNLRVNSSFHDVDRPLSYRFGYDQQSKVHPRYLTESVPIIEISTPLPAGTSSNRACVAFVEVTDVYGSQTTSETPLTVNPLESDAADVETLATNLLDGARAKGDYQRSGQLVQAIADTLNLRAGVRRLAVVELGAYSELARTRQLLVLTLQQNTVAQTLTQQIAERISQSLAAVTVVSTDLSVTSIDQCISICEKLIVSGAINDGAAANLVNSVDNVLAGSTLLQASSSIAWSESVISRCRTLLYQTAEIIASRRVPGEKPFKVVANVHTFEVFVYPASHSMPISNLSLTSGHPIPVLIVNWKADPNTLASPQSGNLNFASAVITVKLMGSLVPADIAADVHLSIFQVYNSTLACAVWNFSARRWVMRQGTAANGGESISCRLSQHGGD
eukprot:SAG25_NODE_1573_length_2748_cov_1.528124_1_plen_392_part_10